MLSSEEREVSAGWRESAACREKVRAELGVCREKEGDSVGPEWEIRCCSVECWPEPTPLENPEENQAAGPPKE